MPASPDRLLVYMLENGDDESPFLLEEPLAKVEKLSFRQDLSRNPDSKSLEKLDPR